MTTDAKHQREVLAEHLAILETRLAHLEDHQRNRDGREPSADSEEFAAQLQNEEVVEDLLPRTLQHLSAIRRAIARLDAGDSFTCANCGRPIDPRRLALVPEAETCARCA